MLYVRAPLQAPKANDIDQSSLSASSSPAVSASVGAPVDLLALDAVISPSQWRATSSDV
jgi:hypothetical protein